MVTSGWPQATQSPLLAGTRRSMTGIPDVSLLPPTDRSEGPRAIMHLKTLCLVFKNPSLKATGKLRFFFFFSVSCPFSLLGVLILLQRLLSRVWLYGTSLVVQWFRIHLPMQGTWVQSLVQEDPTCHGATKPSCSRACVLQPEKPPKWEAHTSKLDSSPHFQQLEKAQAQQ